VLLLTGDWSALGALAGVRGAARGELDSQQIDAEGNDWHPVPEPEVSSIESADLEAELALLDQEPSEQEPSEQASSNEDAEPPRQPVIGLLLLPDWSRFERFD
jgi:hypothetical protein